MDYSPNESYCEICGKLIEKCECQENKRQKRLFQLGIASITIGIVGFLLAFLF